MRIKTALKLIISVIFFALLPTVIFAEDFNVSINASIDIDLYSQLELSPASVEIRQPSQLQISIVDSDGTPQTGKTVVVYAEGNPSTVSITQPSLTNSLGKTTSSIYSTQSGSYEICAKYTTDGKEIYIEDCQTLYITPVPTPILLSEPAYSKGLDNTVLWNTVGSSSYQYKAEVSTKSDFSSIESNSGWVDTQSYNFTNLQDGQMYFYRVKAKNIYNAESTWSNSVYSVQDALIPVLAVLDVSSIGDNFQNEWDEEYLLNFKYRVKDNVGISDKSFWCLSQTNQKFECNYTNYSDGDFWNISIKLNDLEKTSAGYLYGEYVFCVEAIDNVGNIARDCNAKITIPKKQTVTEPSQPISKPVDGLIDNISRVIDGTIGNLEVIQVQNITTTTAIANIAVSMSIIATLIGSLPYFLLQITFTILNFLGLRKKGNVTGYVYDSISKEPIRQAIVRIFNNNNELIWTDVTDGYGYFKTREVENMEYYIKVAARGYSFPSQIIFGKTDFPLENIYNGDSFTVVDNNIPIFSIPMDKLEINQFEFAIQKLISRFKWLGHFFRIAFFIVGLLFSIYALQTTPAWWNYTIVALYIPSAILIFFSLFNKKEKYGVVRDESKNSLEGIVVGLYEIEFNKLVSKRVTNKYGKYRFIVDSGVYSISILNSDYRLVGGEKFSRVEIKKHGSNILCPNLTVRKLEDSSTDVLIEPLEEL